MRCHLWLALALVLLPVCASGQPQPAVATAGEWVRLVDAHQPGTLDDAALTIAGWAVPRIEEVRTGLRKFLFLERSADPERANQVYERGALLHTDIAVLAPERARLFLGTPGSYTSSTLALDGERQDEEMVTGHWGFARMLLDAVKPEPSQNAAVRKWYVAVAAYMEMHALLGIAAPHLIKARELLRNDPDIQFYSGAMHEAFASPRYQAVVRASAPSHADLLRRETRRRDRIGIDSPRTELQRAERYFRRALELRPGFVEARIRLGRVLGGMNRHEEAARELDGALTMMGAAGEPILRYFAHLFLGDAQSALGRREAAHDNFQAAAAISPVAQSPLLALGELARRHGDRQGALAAMRTLAALDPIERVRQDPWWVYSLAQGRHWESMFAQLREPFLQRREPGARR